MSLDGACLTCFCGRSFSQQSAFSNHERVCQKSKKRLSSVLEKAKELWSIKKRRRLDPGEIAVNEHSLAGLIREQPPASADVDVVEVCHDIFIECKC
jgi:hypothetical protein